MRFIIDYTHFDFYITIFEKFKYIFSLDSVNPFYIYYKTNYLVIFLVSIFFPENIYMGNSILKKYLLI